MPLKILAEAATLECRFADAVNAYSNAVSIEFGQGHAAASPVDSYPLESYGDVPVVSTGILMASRRSRKLRERYQNGCSLAENDIPRMSGDGVYFKPIMVRSRDGRINWQS